MDDEYDVGHLLASQIVAQGQSWSGERRLMLAILEDALTCFQKYSGLRDPNAKIIFNEAEEWIFAEGQSWVFSFERICDELNLSAAYLRRGLHRWQTRGFPTQLQSA